MPLSAEMAIALDPAQMMVRAGYAPDPWQADVLRRDDINHLLNCTRQGGKSSVIACKALHKALYYAPSLTLILSPSERQSKLLLEKVSEIKEKLGFGASAIEETDSTLQMGFASGSEIIALPGKEQNVRGFSSVALAIIDEASRVPDSLYNAVRPMLSVSKGKLCVLSTPWGKRGFFHKEWTEGSGWNRVMIRATECPRITPAFLAGEKLSLPDSVFRQEYMCEFSDTLDSVFRYEDIQAAMSDDIEPLFKTPGLEDNGVTPLFQ